MGHQTHATKRREQFFAVDPHPIRIVAHDHPLVLREAKFNDSRHQGAITHPEAEVVFSRRQHDPFIGEPRKLGE
jgi:hypothetical protein